jgi:sugar lactone lactonase YvrE
MKKILAICFTCIALHHGSWAQNPLKEYQWRTHLSYNHAWSLAEYNNRMYCVIAIPDPGNDPYYKQFCQGLFYFNKGDNSYERLSKVEGLSDVDPVLVRRNPYNNTLFIGYDNANVDILHGDNVLNVSDIKRKQIIGSKKINSVTFNGKYALVSTSLGIVVIDTDNGDVKDSYILGPNGTYLNVYECTFSLTTIYAATSAGIYYAPINAPNLSNFLQWTREASLPVGPYNTIVNFKGTIITNFSKLLQSNMTVSLQDSLYEFNGTSWVPYPYKGHDAYSYTIRKIIADDARNRIAFLDNFYIDIKDDAGTSISTMWRYSSTIDLSFGEYDLLFDDNSYYWVADKNQGLVHCKADNTSPVALTYEHFIPNGPNTFLVNDIKIHDKKIIVAPIFLSDYPSNSYFQEGLYIYENETWRHVRKVLGGPYFDINSVTIDPADDTHLYAGSYGGGVLEFRGDSVVAVYNNTNSGLPIADGGGGIDSRVTSVETDADGNLWVASGYTKKCITARDAAGTWHSLQFANSVITDQLIVDKSKQVWVISLSPGIVVYKHDGSFAAPSTANSYTINTADEDGKISGSIIYCLTEDKDGDIWIGTNKGVFVIYDPESIIANQSYTAQQILIQENNITKVLFETEDISCITVDGANNKWVGTHKNGVFCVSPDGQKELHHFTKDNSPLFSDNIVEIAVNPQNGEVFFSTDKGMISFQNTVIEGLEEFTDVYAYPNPVKPAYTGPVMIKGLVSGSSLKIIDVAGNFVYETIVEGGQAVWNAKNFKGERVASGVYMAMCATTDGSKKAVCKIMVIN